MKPSFERRGLDMLLARYPEAEVLKIEGVAKGYLLVRDSPWLTVVLSAGDFAIWKVTGAVYRMESTGAVVDDPFLVPEGSLYGDGPVEA